MKFQWSARLVLPPREGTAAAPVSVANNVLVPVGSYIGEGAVVARVISRPRVVRALIWNRPLRPNPEGRTDRGMCPSSATNMLFEVDWVVPALGV